MKMSFFLTEVIVWPIIYDRMVGFVNSIVVCPVFLMEAALKGPVDKQDVSSCFEGS